LGNAHLPFLRRFLPSDWASLRRLAAHADEPHRLADQLALGEAVAQAARTPINVLAAVAVTARQSR
jgi:hypothetical protein